MSSLGLWIREIRLNGHFVGLRWRRPWVWRRKRRIWWRSSLGLWKRGTRLNGHFVGLRWRRPWVWRRLWWRSSPGLWIRETRLNGHFVGLRWRRPWVWRRLWWRSSPGLWIRGTTSTTTTRNGIHFVIDLRFFSGLSNKENKIKFVYKKFCYYIF